MHALPPCALVRMPRRRLVPEVRAVLLTGPRYARPRRHPRRIRVRSGFGAWAELRVRPGIVLPLRAVRAAVPPPRRYTLSRWRIWGLR